MNSKKIIAGLLFVFLPIMTPLSVNALEIKNDESGLCLDVAQNRPGGNVVIDVCQPRRRAFQKWVVRNGNQLLNSRSGLCLDVSQNRPGGNVVIDRCGSRRTRAFQFWRSSGNKIRNIEADLCLDVSQNRPGGNVVIDRCERRGRPFQVWEFN